MHKDDDEAAVDECRQSRQRPARQSVEWAAECVRQLRLQREVHLPCALLTHTRPRRLLLRYPGDAIWEYLRTSASHLTLATERAWSKGSGGATHRRVRRDVSKVPKSVTEECEAVLYRKMPSYIQGGHSQKLRVG